MKLDSFDDAKTIVVDGAVFADGKGVFTEASDDGDALAGIADAIKAVADPLGSFDGAGFSVELESGGDFALPILGFSKEENGIGGGRAGFPADFFEGIFKIHSDAAGEKDGEVEIELGLPFDEAIEAVGHFGVDIGVLFLFVDDAFIFGTEIDDIGAGENADGFGDAIADGHGAGSASGEKGEG